MKLVADGRFIYVIVTRKVSSISVCKNGSPADEDVTSKERLDNICTINKVSKTEWMDILGLFCWIEHRPAIFPGKGMENYLLQTVFSTYRTPFGIHGPR